MKQSLARLKAVVVTLVSRDAFMLLVLLGVLQLSAVGVVYSTYQSRQLFSQLEQMRDSSEEMQVVWRQLLLEQSTLASFSRVVDVASSELAMTVPDPEQIVILQQ